MRRAVLDPGVLIAALISSQGAPARLIALWIEGAFELIVSPKLLEELRAVLLRPKFRRYATTDEVEAYVGAIGRLAFVVADPDEVRRVSDDPKDDYLVALASASSATLVSGDPHLTQVKTEVRAIVPRDFVETLS
jgi:putative PIN family toxin of toxin-antitoxin system